MVPVYDHHVDSRPRIPTGGRYDPLTQLEARPDARPALEAWLREQGTLEAAAARHPEAEVLAGRGRVHVVPAPTGGEDERWVVRHYHRGGAIASLLGDRYLRVGRPRPLRELRVGWGAEARGVPTAVHIGAAVYRSGIWYRGDLVTRYVPHSRDLAAVLFPGRALDSGPLAGSRAKIAGTSAAGASSAGASREADPVAAMTAAGRLLRRIHEGGVDHPDLNLKNILIRGTGAELDALVLDLDSATLTPEPERAPVGDAARARMVARFWRSARKWERATGIDLGPSLRAAFEAGYAAGYADGSSGRPGASGTSGPSGSPGSPGSGSDPSRPAG